MRALMYTVGRTNMDERLRKPIYIWAASQK